MRRLVCLLSGFLLVLSACSSSNDQYEFKSQSEKYRQESAGKYGEDGRLGSEVKVSEPVKPAQTPTRFPWEAWILTKDLSGKPIGNPGILAGDEYLRMGQRAQALDEFNRVNRALLSQEEEEALVFRMASTELALDKPQQALSTLTAFFARYHASVEQIDARFSIVYAYAYGRSGDRNQAFAWFSRVNRLAAGQGGFYEASSQGVRLLVRQIPDVNFTEVVNTWRNDSFVHTILGQEMRRRATTGDQVLASSVQPFWIDPDVKIGSAVTEASQTAPKVIAVLLPLTGQFAALGKASKNGMELGFEGQASNSEFLVDYRDERGDMVQAASIFQQFLNRGDAFTFLGPLVSQPASAIADIARSKKISGVVLTKNDSFVPGEGVLRLGPTVESQVSSLFAAAQSVYGIRNFAFVYPNDPTLIEFVSAAKRILKEQNIEPVYENSYMRGDTTAFKAIAAEIESRQVQAVFFPDDLQAAINFRLNISEGLRREIRMLGTARWDNPPEIQRAWKALEGVIYVSPYFQQSTDPFFQQFRTTYKAKFNTEPDFLAAQGFDAATLLVSALHNQQSTGGSLEESFRAIEMYQGLTGTIKLGDRGELKRVFSVLEVTPDGFRPIQAE